MLISALTRRGSAFVEASWLKQMYKMKVPLSGGAFVETSWLKQMHTALSSSSRCSVRTFSTERQRL